MTTEDKTTEQPSRPNVLRTVLFVILAILVLVVVYDHFWARPQRSRAAQRIKNFSGLKTPDAVQKTVGRPFVERIEHDHYFLEKYSWPAGIPWETRDLYVIYTKEDPPLYHNSHEGDYPPAYLLPQRKSENFPGKVPNQTTEETPQTAP